MIDQKKIILMTKLAMHDKKYGNEDKRRSHYYLEDYIYIKNFKTRVSITFVFIIIASMHLFRMMNNELIIPTNLMEFLGVYIKPYLIPWLIAIMGYTLLSTIIYTKRYALTEERLKKYKGVLKELKSYELKSYEQKSYEQKSLDEERAEDEI